MRPCQRALHTAAHSSTAVQRKNIFALRYGIHAQKRFRRGVIGKNIPLAIHHKQTRLKSLQSIVEKLQRKGLPVTMTSAATNLTDIAGVRVICSYLDDIYTVARLLLQQDDVKLLRTRDYIREPKPNGYRSLHLIIQVPVYLSEGKLLVPVEVQIRTIAMDFWATLEHQLRYKAIPTIPASISDELVQTATDISLLDQRMQRIHDQVELLERDEREKME